MKTVAFIRREAINWILILLPLFCLIFIHYKLPRFAPIPLDSEQNIYYVLMFNFGVSFLVYTKLLIKPLIDPKTTLHSNLRTLHRFKTLILLFISLLSLTYISEAIEISFDWTKIGFIAAMLFITVLGNLYPTLKHNYFIGLKNAWTLSDELIWNRTHRFAGKVFFWGGLSGIIYGIFFNVTIVPYMPAVFFWYVSGLVLIPHIYSYILHRKLQVQQSKN